MAKAASPVRLQDDLMQAATMVGERQHRSAAEQIEYWASQGRSIGEQIDPDSLLAIATGIARLTVESVAAPRIDPEDVFKALERDREAGTLASKVSSNALRYQVSLSHPGQLEQITTDGQVVIGQFNQGVFTPLVD